MAGSGRQGRACAIHSCSAGKSTGACAQVGKGGTRALHSLLDQDGVVQELGGTAAACR